jgi:hypothetical protein
VPGLSDRGEACQERNAEVDTLTASREQAVNFMIVALAEAALQKVFTMMLKVLDLQHGSTVDTEPLGGGIPQRRRLFCFFTKSNGLFDQLSGLIWCFG